jgi:Carboxypeptidase regulatory-like domain
MRRKNSAAGMTSGLPCGLPCGSGHGRATGFGLMGSALALILIAACASTLAAQKKKDDDASTRTVQGTVLDADGSPVQQAVVQLKDTRSLQVLSFITKEDGAYHFASLKTDIEYEVKAAHGGSSTDWKRVSIFDTRKIVVVNLKLQKSDLEKK